MFWSAQVGQTLQALQGKEVESEQFKAKLAEHIQQMTQTIVGLQNSDAWVQEALHGLSEELKIVCKEFIPETLGRMFACEESFCIKDCLLKKSWNIWQMVCVRQIKGWKYLPILKLTWR